MKSSGSWLKKGKDISIIITCVSLVVGMVVAFFNIKTSSRQARFAGLGQAKEYFIAEEKIKDKIALFLTKHSDRSYPTSLPEKYKSGRAMYFSKDMRDFKEICHHYETMGALINADYLDFNLYYQIMSFPDDFYDQTQPLRKVIRDNWSGRGKPLNDFLSNFESLRKRYQEYREKKL